MQRAILCSLVLASTPHTTPTFAQQVWDFAGPEAGQFQARAGVCPLGDAETGNFLCFTLSCDKNGPLQWGILAAGEGIQTVFPRATLSFRGSVCGRGRAEGCQKRYAFMNAQMVEK